MTMLSYIVSDQPVPCTIYPTEESRDASLDNIVSWLSREQRWLGEQLLCKGAVLLRGFSAIRDAESFAAVVSTFCSHFMNYEGGTTPRTMIRNHIFTSTEAPHFLPIELHQEMSYQAHFPDRIAFFCEMPSDRGGETPIVDMRAVYHALPLDLTRRFEEKGLRLRRRLAARRKGKRKIRTWSETFGTESRAEIERMAEERGWRLAWASSYLEVENEIRPASITHPQTGERVWFNQAHVLHKSSCLYWARHYGSAKLWLAALLMPVVARHFHYHYVYGDGSEIQPSDLHIIRNTIRMNEIKFRWFNKDIIIIDNLLMAHGRTPYIGNRRILASLMKL